MNSKTFVPFPFHNPFDINSYPITNPPLFDSTMNLPYDLNDGVNRRRRISISNGQIGQIINHEAIFNYDNNDFHPFDGMYGRDVYKDNHNHQSQHQQQQHQLQQQQQNGSSSNTTTTNSSNNNNNSNASNNYNNYGKNQEILKDGYNKSESFKSHEFEANGSANNLDISSNIPISDGLLVINGQISHVSLSLASQVNSTVPDQVSQAPAHTNHSTSEIEFQQNPMFPPQQSRNMIPLKQDKIVDVAGVPPPNHQLIYNDEVIFNPNNGPIPGTAAWKKERLLERNRIAASKCRQRKKQAHLKLQDNISKFEKELQSKTDSINNLIKIIKFYNKNLKNYFETGNDDDLQELKKYIEIDDLENLENWAESQLSESQ